MKKNSLNSIEYTNCERYKNNLKLLKITKNGKISKKTKKGLEIIGSYDIITISTNRGKFFKEKEGIFYETQYCKSIGTHHGGRHDYESDDASGDDGCLGSR